MSDPLAALGVDPGSYSGGAARLVDGAVVAWLAWTWLDSGGGRLRYRGTGLDLPAAGAPLFDAAVRLAALGPAVVVVEGLFVSPRRGRAGAGRRASVLPLAESAGELVGPLRALGPMHRPPANTWRHDVLGLPPDTGAGEAEARAVTWARRRLTWAAELPRWGLTYAEEGAVCEAACMAAWGLRAAV